MTKTRLSPPCPYSVVWLCPLTFTPRCDVAEQIKQLQQDSRTAQMKSDASWAQSIWPTDSRQGTVGGLGDEDEFIKSLQNKSNTWESGDISDVQASNLRSEYRSFTYTFTYERRQT